MREIGGIVASIVSDVIYSVTLFVKENLRNFANLLILLSPFVSLLVGQEVYKERGKFAIGGEIFIPICILIFAYFLISYANKIGKGTTIPVPAKRFTEIDDDDEVSIENNRLQELILYMADLEDWLERKGLL